MNRFGRDVPGMSFRDIASEMGEQSSGNLHAACDLALGKILVAAHDSDDQMLWDAITTGEDLEHLSPPYQALVGLIRKKILASVRTNTYAA